MLTLSAGGARAAESVLVTGLKAEVTGQATTVTAEISVETRFSVTTLADPHRVVIDIPNARFDLPSGIGRKKKGLVQQMRYGKSPQGDSQIVINTTGPVRVAKRFAAGRTKKAKARLIVELAAAKPEDFGRSAQQNSSSSFLSSASSEITASLPRYLPRWMPAPMSGRKVIVIDPGHGGIDPGAVSPRKIKEKDVVFVFAKALKAALDATGHFDVRLTRTDDRFVSLRERVKFGQDAKADLFIAIHADTVRGQTVTGTTLYTLSERASDAEAEALAQKENKVDMIAGLDLAEQTPQVADILIDLVQRESKNHAVLFAGTALEHLHGVTTMTGKPLRSARFMVLRAPDVPSILIELGYLSSREDEARLLSPAWRRNMAEALALAVSRHFAPAGTAAATP